MAGVWVLVRQLHALKAGKVVDHNGLALGDRPSGDEARNCAHLLVQANGGGLAHLEDDLRRNEREVLGHPALGPPALYLRVDPEL